MTIHKLKQTQVDKFIRTGRLSDAKGKPVTRLGDGGNLYVVRNSETSAYWTFIATRGGKTVELGGGSARDVSLVRAREWAPGLEGSQGAVEVRGWRADL